MSCAILFRRALVAVVLVAGTAILPVEPAHASVSTVEVRVLELINQGRAGVGKGAEVMHAGLRTAARGHSSYQASIRRLTHDGLAGRISSAAPDPYESNGAPDDGFRSYCENVAYFYPGSAGATDEQVAQKLYNLWYNSAGHRNCMFDSYGYSLNVAGLGVHLDSQGYWWATFESVRDLTPPSAGTWTRYEQTSSAVTYSGSWTTYTNSNASGGSYKRADVTGAYARFAFTGRGVRWIGLRGPLGGYAEVRLDGTLVATISQYASTTTYLRTLFERTGLTYGSHTLEVRRTATKHPSSSSYQTWVDAFMRLA